MIFKKTMTILLVAVFLASLTATIKSTKDCENGEISTGGGLGEISNFRKKEYISGALYDNITYQYINKC
jgi:hypothetical protein